MSKEKNNKNDTDMRSVAIKSVCLLAFAPVVLFLTLFESAEQKKILITLEHKENLRWEALVADCVNKGGKVYDGKTKIFSRSPAYCGYNDGSVVILDN